MATKRERTMHESERFPSGTDGLPDASRPALVELRDGDVYDLAIAPVAKTIGESRVRMVASTGPLPAPPLKAPEAAKLTVRASNRAHLDATVHWHGLRRENRYDGT